MILSLWKLVVYLLCAIVQYAICIIIQLLMHIMENGAFTIVKWHYYMTSCRESEISCILLLCSFDSINAYWFHCMHRFTQPTSNFIKIVIIVENLCFQTRKRIHCKQSNLIAGIWFHKIQFTSSSSRMKREIEKRKIVTLLGIAILIKYSDEKLIIQWFHSHFNKVYIFVELIWWWWLTFLFSHFIDNFRINRSQNAYWNGGFALQ